MRVGAENRSRRRAGETARKEKGEESSQHVDSLRYESTALPLSRPCCLNSSSTNSSSTVHHLGLAASMAGLPLPRPDGLGESTHIII
jgi:hypothetical protein